MPGEDIQSWSTTAATNATADTSINWAEGQPRASVNNSARSMMAAHAKQRNLQNGSITTGGTANAQTFTSGVSYTVVPTGLTVRLKIGVTNTGAATLNMDSIAAVAIKDQAGLDIGANALTLGRYADFLYNGTNWILLQVGAAAAPFDALAYGGMQINGSIDVSQERGISATAATNTHICDGWRLDFGGTMVISGAQTPIAATSIPGFSNMLVATVTTAQVSFGASDFTLVSQKIEGYRVARLAWGTANAQPITIAFWSAHHRTGLYSVAVRNAAVNRSYVTTYTQNVADVPQYNTVTIPGDTTGTWAIDNTTGMSICFTMGAGSTLIAGSANSWTASGAIVAPGQINAVAATSDVFRITGVVVLPGSDAPAAARSALIMRPYTEELRICQRYYEKITGGTVFAYQTASQYVVEHYPFKVSKRATPTMGSLGWDDTSNASGQAAGNATTEAFSFQAYPVVTGTFWFRGLTTTADARL